MIQTQRQTSISVYGQECALWIAFDDVTLDVLEVKVDARGLNDFDYVLRFKGSDEPRGSKEEKTFDVTGLKMVKVANKRDGSDAFDPDFDIYLDVAVKSGR